ncbi:2-methylfumaryl-CoA hydratase [Natronosalvus halobius]|uniref:2-methylfumaryl-CoA hydratase n=1 Tax=Natronosalvus halobius TaxID=2953746 RepID=UPI00209D1AF3|nr:2-methylfumaryl-CoA hydratase [Natronosalvus halobius]USZ71906.1 acyl dehydratase [Natronosalvus halobius]
MTDTDADGSRDHENDSSAREDLEWTDPDTFASALERADTREKGHSFEDFAEGDVIEHEPGLRLTRWGNELWTSQTLNHDPAYWRADVARDRGFDEPPIHPDYLLAATLGCTVEDLSEKGGYFLGRTNVRFPADVVAPGTDLRVESEVLTTKGSNSRPDYGIVTWATRGYDARTGNTCCTYERTNMIPRRERLETDGGGVDTDGDGRSPDANHSVSALPETFVTPEGTAFEDFEAALETAEDRDTVVAYRHERGRTMDDVTVATLPLSTLNTAKQHHNANAMADAPSGGIVAYGDVTRSTALGHARSDERTHREVGFEDERFHAFVTPGDTVYCFTRVLETSRETTTANERAGTVRFQHVAFNQSDEPVYSGIRTAEILTRDD